MNPYETVQYLNEYLFFHYGEPGEFCPFRCAPKEAFDFQRRIARECLLPVRFAPPTRGLDVGCAVGRSTFELARKVDFALGIDNSRQFVRAARRIASQHSIAIRVKEEGEIYSRRRVRLPNTLHRSSVRFEVGDAQNISNVRGRPFHVVLAINLIDRLPQPRRFLDELPSLVVPGGQVVIASPYTWMEQFTPRRNWLAGRTTRTSEVLDSILRPRFRLAHRRDMPFLIREHRRKYQWCVSEVSTYVRE